MPNEYTRAPTHLNATTVYVSITELDTPVAGVSELAMQCLRQTVKRPNVKTFEFVDNRTKITTNNTYWELIHAIFQEPANTKSNMEKVTLHLPAEQVRQPGFDEWIHNNPSDQPRRIKVLSINDPVLIDPISKRWLYTTESLTHLQVTMEHSIQGIDVRSYKNQQKVKVVRWVFSDEEINNESFNGLLDVIPKSETVCLRMPNILPINVVKNVVTETMFHADALIVEGTFHIPQPLVDEIRLLVDVLDTFYVVHKEQKTLTLSLEVVLPRKSQRSKEEIVQFVMTQLNSEVIELVKDATATLFRSPMVQLNMRIISRRGDMVPVISNVPKHHALKTLLDPFEYYKKWEDQRTPVY